MHRYNHPAIMTICDSRMITNQRPIRRLRVERILPHVNSLLFVSRSIATFRDSRADDAHGETHAKPFTIVPRRHYAIINRVAATDNLHLRGGRKALLRITTRRACKRTTANRGRRRRGSFYTVSSLFGASHSFTRDFLR